MKELGLKQIDYDTLSIPGRLDIEANCKAQSDVPIYVGEKRMASTRPEIFGSTPFSLNNKDDMLEDILSIDEVYSSKRARHV